MNLSGWLLLETFMLVGLAGAGLCRDVYVAAGAIPSGNGSSTQPYASLEEAVESLNTPFPTSNDEGNIIVHISAGIYHLTSPLIIDGLKTGDLVQTLELRGEPGKFPVLDGGTSLRDWTKREDGLWQTSIREGSPVREFYVNGSARPRAGRKQLSGIDLKWDKSLLV